MFAPEISEIVWSEATAVKREKEKLQLFINQHATKTTFNQNQFQGLPLFLLIKFYGEYNPEYDMSVIFKDSFFHITGTLYTLKNKYINPSLPGNTFVGQNVIKIEVKSLRNNHQIIDLFTYQINVDIYEFTTSKLIHYRNGTLVDETIFYFHKGVMTREVTTFWKLNEIVSYSYYPNDLVVATMHRKNADQDFVKKYWKHGGVSFDDNPVDIVYTYEEALGDRLHPHVRYLMFN